MAPKAIDARKRIDRNRRFRGHGPLLQKAWAVPTMLGAPQPLSEGPTAPKAIDARKRIDRNHRFRGHGPLLQKAWAIPTTLGAPQPL